MGRDVEIYTADGEVILSEWLEDDETEERYCADCDDKTPHHADDDYCLECGYETR